MRAHDKDVTSADRAASSILRITSAFALINFVINVAGHFACVIAAADEKLCQNWINLIGSQHLSSSKTIVETLDRESCLDVASRRSSAVHTFLWKVVFRISRTPGRISLTIAPASSRVNRTAVLCRLIYVGTFCFIPPKPSLIASRKDVNFGIQISHSGPNEVWPGPLSFSLLNCTHLLQ